MSSPKKIARLLSIVIAVLAFMASLGGLLFENLYHDSDFIKMAWYGNDWVTLIVVVPSLLVCIERSGRGSERAHLIWLGLLWYMLYNYAFYLFGAQFNAFFLLYVGLFSLSIYALFISLSSLDIPGLTAGFSEKTPVKWIGVVLLLVVLPLSVVELGACFRYITSGILPQTPSLIYALDLSLVVPNMFLAAILLWRRLPWGYILGAIMLVKGTFYGTVLIVSSLLIQFSSIPQKDSFWPFYLFVALACTTGLIALLNHLKPTQ